jgi:CBS domain-containing protein/uncharacterized protein (DUF2267 family)
MALAKYTQARLVAQHPDTLVYDALRAMEDNHIGAIIVHDGSQVVGIVTDRDLALRVLMYDRDPFEVELRNIMSKPVAVLPVTASEVDAAEAMLAGHVRRIVILEGRTLAGIVTLDDLILERAIEPTLLAAIVRAQLSEPARLKSRTQVRPMAARGERHERAAQRHDARSKVAYDNLLGRTVDATGLPTRDDAEAALDTVITGLLRRIRPEEARHLLAELPQMLRERLADVTAGPDRNITLGELEGALEARLNVDHERAAEIVRQIGRALEETISAGEIEDVQAQLPAEMKRMFEGPFHSPGPSSS